MNKKQDKIINACINLFLQYGIRKTTMDDIAKSANVSKVTIYKYFGDKDSLYLAVGISIFNYYISLLKLQSEQSLPIDSKLEKVLDTLTELIASNKLMLCKELSRLNDSLYSEYENFYTEYKNIIIKLLDEGKSFGKIKNKINNEIGFHYIDMGLSYFENNLDYRHRILNDSVFQQEYINFVLSNIFVKEGKL